jgi:ferric-dicitrate binding protein FerR (iron transport regulator)
MFYNEEKAHIEQLLLKKHSGLLTKEEQLEFDNLLQDNPEFKQLASYYEGRHEQLLTAVDGQIVEHKLIALKERLKRDRTHPIIYRRIAPYTAVAAVAVLAIVALIVTNHSINLNPKKENRLANVGSSSNKQVILHLAGGQEIILNQSGKQSIQAGNKRLVADNKTLNLSSSTDRANGWNTLEVPRKLDYKVNLADGSTVHLNSASKLKFPFTFTGTTREVYVEGEAYFIIAAKAGHPFIVHTEQGDITVLGTEFNINTYTPEVLKAALVNGAVQVSTGGNQVVLKPGEYFTKIGAYNSIVPLDSKAILSWQKGVYYFHNTPFREIAAMLPRWFDVRVIIDDESLNDMPFTGELDKAESLDIFLKAMQYTSGIEYHNKDGVLHISK